GYIGGNKGIEGGIGRLGVGDYEGVSIGGHSKGAVRQEGAALAKTECHGPCARGSASERNVGPDGHSSGGRGQRKGRAHENGQSRGSAEARAKLVGAENGVSTVMYVKLPVGEGAGRIGLAGEIRAFELPLVAQWRRAAHDGSEDGGGARVGGNVLRLGGDKRRHVDGQHGVGTDDGRGSILDNNTVEAGV